MQASETTCKINNHTTAPCLEEVRKERWNEVTTHSLGNTDANMTLRKGSSEGG
jgi:hypothetical protein